MQPVDKAQSIDRECGRMDLPVRDFTHWATGYGLPRTMLKLLARQGDPMAKLLTIDSNPVDDIYPLIEQVRAPTGCSTTWKAGLSAIWSPSMPPRSRSR